MVNCKIISLSYGFSALGKKPTPFSKKQWWRVFSTGCTVRPRRSAIVRIKDLIFFFICFLPLKFRSQESPKEQAGGGHAQGFSLET